MNSPKTSCLLLSGRGDGMYESPINLLYAPFVSKVLQEQENTIVKVVQKVCVDVDKDELVKALAYDRGQYDRGYADGRAARDREIVRCEDCKYLSHFDDEEVDLWCGVWANKTSEDCFCKWGKRKENDEEEETA